MKMKHTLFGFIFFSLNTGFNPVLFAQGTWQQVRKADWEFGLDKICFPTTEKGFILGTHEELLFSTDGGGSWKSYEWPDTMLPYLNGFLEDIYFVDSSVGWIVTGEGRILYTIDTGENWSLQETDTREALLECHFSDRKHGTAVGWNTILHTADGGRHWTKQFTNFDVYLYTVFFIDSLKGWCGGRYGTILHTENGGLTWHKQETFLNNTIMKITFLDEKRGWAAGSEATVLRTLDGGITWERLDIETKINYLIDDIIFLNENEGWIVGGKGYSGGSTIILHTTNGGTSWQFQRAPTLNHLTSVFFKDELHGWITGLHGTLLSTENGGVDWHLAVKATSNTLNAVSFVDKDYGWAIGTSTLIHTKDGGTTWVACDTLEGNDIVFMDRHKGWFVHAGKGIYHTEDGGDTWQLQHAEKRLYRIYFFDSLHGWAMSGDSAGSNILYTKDGGNNWIHQTRLTVRPLQSIFFVDSLTGWAVGDFGVIHHTVDASQTWELQRQGTNGGDTLYDLFFVNESTGWAVGEIGILHTANGGKSWQSQPCPIGQYEWLMSVHFTDENHGWVVGMMGVMLYTEDGGKHWDRRYSRDYGYWWADVCFTDRDHGWAVGLYGAIYKWTGNALAIADTKEEELSKHFELQQNYPNPFSPHLSLQGTRINYSLPTSASVTIKILNILGQTVYTIVEGEKPPGNHSVTWNGNDYFGNLLPNGIYFCQVRAGKEVKVGKMTLVR